MTDGEEGAAQQPPTQEGNPAKSKERRAAVTTWTKSQRMHAEQWWRYSAQAANQLTPDGQRSDPRRFSCNWSDSIWSGANFYNSRTQCTTGITVYGMDDAQQCLPRSIPSATTEKLLAQQLEPGCATKAFHFSSGPDLFQQTWTWRQTT